MLTAASESTSQVVTALASSISETVSLQDMRSPVWWEGDKGGSLNSKSGRQSRVRPVGRTGAGLCKALARRLERSLHADQQAKFGIHGRTACQGLTV